MTYPLNTTCNKCKNAYFFLRYILYQQWDLSHRKFFYETANRFKFLCNFGNIDINKDTWVIYKGITSKNLTKWIFLLVYRSQ